MKSSANVVTSDTLRAVAPGGGLVIVRAAFTVLIDDSSADRAQAVWRAIGAEQSVDAVVDVLAKDGLRSMPGAVIAVREGLQLRLIVRGAVLAEIAVDGDTSSMAGAEPHVLDGTTIRSWTETTIDDWITCRMYLAGSMPSDWADADRAEFGTLLSSGIAPAGAVIWERGGDADDAISVGTESGSEGPQASFESAVQPTATDVVSHASDRDVSARDADVPAGSVNAETNDGDDDDDRHGDADDTLPEDAGDDPYAEMFGRTVHRDVQAAAVEAPSDPIDETPITDDLDVEVDSVGSAAAIAGHSASASAPTNETRSLADFRDGQVASAPATQATPATQSATPPPLAPPTVPGAASTPGDHDGHTISVTELRRRRSESSDEPLVPASSVPTHPAAGPTVQAVLCPEGHPNPAYASLCRQCNEAVSGDIVVVARPSLGRLRASSGEIVELDRPVIVGRNPSLTGRRVSEIPQEWRIALAEGLSRSHAMFHIDGWQVRVEDLGSVNSTTVTLPGREPTMLRAGEPVLITDGTFIDLGGEVTCTYDATA